MNECIVALVGNPNTGKTTLFNSISKTNEHVGNWHGVTVDYKEKKLKSQDGKGFVLTDLPGVYSLSSYSYEEAVTRDYLLSHQNCKIINICDANNLERNLCLTLQLLEMGFNPILCINMANELKKTGRQINVKLLEKNLGLKVFLINASKVEEVRKVVEFTIAFDNKYQIKNLTYVNNLQSMFDKLFYDKKQIKTFEKIKVLEQDEFYFNKLKIDYATSQQKLINKKTLDYVAEQRYAFIDTLCSKCITYGNFKKIYGYSKLDNLFLNKWLSLPIFFVLVSIIFWLTFGQVGSTISELLANFCSSKILAPITNFIKQSTSNNFVIDFLSNAVFGSFVSLLSFLPQICLMFLGLFILEDTGYMARLAFIVEDFLKKLGLSGKSIFTLLMGFGCSTTSALACKTMEDRNGKIKTAIIAPYISCSAKLPLYAVICNAFFPNVKFLIVVLLYMFSVIVSLAVCYFLNKSVLKSGNQSFIMEFPEYRFPSFKRILKNIFVNIKQFVLRIGTVLLGFSCLIWIAENCNFKLQYGVGDSILKTIAGFISPIFSPLGFGNYGAAACLICGFVAKEIIVSTIAMINNCGSSGDIDLISKSLLLSTSAFMLTPASSLSFLVFSVLYIPCVSTVSVLSREIGTKWTLVACIIQFGLSYVLSFLVYKIAIYFEYNGVVSGVLSLIAFVTLTVSLVGAKKIISNRKRCKYCSGCKICNQ